MKLRVEHHGPTTLRMMVRAYDIRRALEDVGTAGTVSGEELTVADPHTAIALHLDLEIGDAQMMTPDGSFSYGCISNEHVASIAESLWEDKDGDALFEQGGAGDSDATD